MRPPHSAESATISGYWKLYLNFILCQIGAGRSVTKLTRRVTIPPCRSGTPCLMRLVLA